MKRGISVLNPTVLVAVLFVSAGYLLVKGPGNPQQFTLRVAMTPERIARGKYIFALADCDGCHSPRDWSRYAGPAEESRRGQGVEILRGRGIPSANITPDPETGIGAWPDGFKIRAIRDGIGFNGKPLDPVMPYARFRRMSDADVYALVAYLNTLSPVKHAVPRRGSLSPRSWLNRIFARSGASVPQPNPGQVVEYGEYLATIAGCRDCHTTESRSPLGQEPPYAGGRRFQLPGGLVISPNITPDPHTGIGRWSQSDWLERVYQHREYLESGAPKAGRGNLTVMPWLGLCRLEPEDLTAIFAYLRTQKPIYRAINPHPME